MQITALGHSCVLLELETDGENTRILLDPWLSDHTTGDAMGRFPRLRFETAALPPIHAVFLSHAHSDHLDPYTLVRLWKELPSPPVLLLPVSLAFLVPVFEAHLEEVQIDLLLPHEPMLFRGLELVGLFDIGPEPNNEEDVMVLVATNGTEAVLVEADARLSLEHPEFRAYVSQLLCGPQIETAVFLTTENELTGTMESRICTSLEEREDLVDRVMNGLLEEVAALYEPHDDPDDLFHCPRLVRLVHGQGLTAPHELDPRWQQILFPIRIEHRVQEERAAAERSGFSHTIDSLTVGAVHRVASGAVQSRDALPGLELLDQDGDRRFDPRLAYFPELPCAPLRSDVRDPGAQRLCILDLLNQRFLPYLHGQRLPPVLHLLSGYGGAYRIRVHFDDGAWDHVLSFAGRAFVQLPAGPYEVQEAYWANDLEDFLNGRADEFTPFCRTQFPVPEMRLWASLATPLLNSDLVLARVTMHFERASAGLSPGSYVLPLYATDAASTP